MRKRLINLGYKILNSRLFSRLFSSYKLTWELAGMTKSTAMDAVLYGVRNELEFWSSGEKDAEELKKSLFTKNVVAVII
jgi:hypothetical protein